MPLIACRREAAAAAIGGSIHALIEQPITTPIEVGGFCLELFAESEVSLFAACIGF